MNQNDMPRTKIVTRFAIQFADGTFAQNCSGRRTHKTAALAQRYIDDCARSELACPSHEALVKQGYSATSATHRIEQAQRITAIFKAAKVVPVEGRVKA